MIFSKKKKILIVDDEEPIGKSVKLNLEDTGRFKVEVETKGVRAINAAISQRPDLILLDFVMPDKDGGSIAAELQKHVETKDIPIIFLTAIATKDDNVHHGEYIGGYRVIPKPATSESIISAIDEVLGEKGK